MQLVLISILSAALLVGGQSLWKKLADNNLGSFTDINFLLSLLINKYFIFGAFLYALATLVYIYALSKFPYFQVQTLVVGGSLLITYTVATLLFNESIAPIKIIGILMLIAGIVVITR